MQRLDNIVAGLETVAAALARDQNKF